MNKNIKKVVAVTVVAGLAVAPVAAQTYAPTAHAAEQAQTKHISAKFVQNAEGNFVEVTATQDVLAAKVTISVNGKGQYTVSVGDLKAGETKLVPFNCNEKVGHGFNPKALPKTSVVADHVTISKTIDSCFVRATVSYKYDDGKAVIKPAPGNNGENGGHKVDPGTPGDRPGIGDLLKPTPTPEPKPEPLPFPEPKPEPKPGGDDVKPGPFPIPTPQPEPPVVKPLPGEVLAPKPDRPKYKTTIGPADNEFHF